MMTCCEDMAVSMFMFHYSAWDMREKLFHWCGHIYQFFSYALYPENHRENTSNSQEIETLYF